MKPARWTGVYWLLTLIAFAPVLQAQQFSPRAGYAYPAGGRQGTTFQVKVGGQFLANATAAHVSGGGIQAVATGYDRPLSPQQLTQSRERLQELQKQPRSAAVLREMVAIREQLASTLRRRANPSLAETVTLRVTIAPDAQPGERELRLQTPAGLSNPLVFCVGQLPEFTEAEPAVTGFLQGRNQPPAGPAAATAITLPATVNGRIVPRRDAQPQAPQRQAQPFTPGDADRYRFQAQCGQQLVVAAAARELIPYLADAVPGWFQATVSLYDAEGRELAYNDDYLFRPDPLLLYEIPKDGEYAIEIRDALYRGREDFVYRLTLGELPFVTGIFPLGGRAGARTTVELRGWNLPAEKLTMAAEERGPGVYPLSIEKGGLVSNRAPFAVDALPEIVESEPNDSPENAQKVTIPVIVNGRTDRPGDRDVFSLEGRAGDALVAEIHARRLASPLDSVLRLTDAAGRQIAFNDDHEDKGSGLNTHHADSLIAATLPADGTYYLHLGDAQQKGGPEYAYRLRISPPQPDFELRVTPSGISALGGTTIPVTVYALRRDGFAGEIALALKGAPRGFTLAGGGVPAGQDKVRLTLTVPPLPRPEPLNLALEGRASIQGREIRRLAVPAEEMMQAFAYRHLVPAKELKAVVGRRVFLSPARVLGAQPVKIPAGGTVRLEARVPIPPNNVLENIRFELSEPPEGIELREMSAEREGVWIVLYCDASKAGPGVKGNLIVGIFAERRPQNESGRAQQNRQRISLGTLPAIPFEIVER